MTYQEATPKLERSLASKISLLLFLLLAAIAKFLAHVTIEKGPVSVAESPKLQYANLHLAPDR